ncbi:alpha/beta hydrolase family protein [Paenibacillus sp. OSY-SE]|uniref:alpha/beta hydrolase family protein n=1 Tax=Paenibacillus sp. OSY-SE TaxID=1196323 RepID=UPI0012F76207|nr:alpha/beta fold hydrolase [Paenibacillus sp. OSY-SE]
MNKSVWRWMMSACLLFGSMAPAALAVEETPAIEKLGEQESATMVPLRQAVESIGAYVKWNSEDKTAKVTYGELVWTVRLNEDRSDVNGQELKLAAKAEFGTEAQGALVVPWDSVKKGLQLNAKWVNDSVVPDASDWKTRASQFVVQWGKLAAQPQAEAQLQKLITPELREATKQMSLSLNTKLLTGMFGLPTQFENAAMQDNGVHQNVSILFKTDKGQLLPLELRYNDQGLVDELFFSAVGSGGYQAPAYDNASAYKEENIVIGEGQFKLPGTLTVPANGESAFPVVVLVHGSGQNDRDESIGAGKMFRDMAVGLAEQGIATIRYEKRTREYPFQATAMPKFTVKEETLDDALEAVKWAGQDERLNKERVYVLGHSQGGMLVPRMLAQDSAKSIRGGIIAAGPSGPLEDLILTQMEGQLKRAKEAGQPEQVTAQIEAQVNMWKQQLQVIKNEKYTADNYPQDLQLAMASWWFDFRNNYGGEIAKDQKIPLFIIQGDNDVQVGKEHLDGWKEALKNRKDVEFKLYPKLNHIFVPSDKPSTGEEYVVPGNVPLDVVNDVAKWVKSH